MDLTATTNAPNELTNGIDYECYGTKYLDILRRATCPGCPPPKEERSKDPFETNPPPSQVLVAALYYTYETDRSMFRNKLSTRQNIVTGDYTSITPEIVTRHLEYARQANVNVWIVEWNGQDTIQDDLLRSEILARDLNEMQISVLYEVRQRVNTQTWDYSRVRADLEHLFSNIVTHEHFFRLHDRPVIFLSLTRWFHVKQQLSTLVQLVRTVAKEKGIPEVYLVGDQIWQSAPLTNEYQPFQWLDVVVNIDVYGNIGDVSQGEIGLNSFYQRQRDWRDAAWRAGCGYIPSVLPGFNNRAHAKNGANKAPVLSRQLNETAAPGSLFVASLKRARYLVDSTLSGLLVVSTFNRWNEDTQIEPVVGKTTALPIELTQNTSYVGYGSLYLEILRDHTQPYNDAKDKENVPQSDQLFSPLQCNGGLTVDSCTATWRDVFGSHTNHSSLVTIPCGQCIVLDQSFGSSDLKLLGGLDIIGMLLIRDLTKLVITTPFIRCV
jgi:hypothetical protein